ncbi:MAG: 23S rRNA (adenine(2030)-N(6))-methyltransferase RlmJ [Hyphomicrobiales bacterium]
MNYRHAYHAGNHADVLKHAVLALCVERFKTKEKPFRVIDAHAGIARYRLESVESQKTEEWRTGLGRLYADDGAPLPLDELAEEALAPWRRAVAAENHGGRLATYPGSPTIAQTLLRAEDRLVVNELHPEDVATLGAELGNDARITVMAIDALSAVKATLPPPERRGIILIDPPYEKNDEAVRAIAALREGAKRFATGTFLLWYPVTGDGLSDRLVADAVALKLPKTLDVRLMVRAAVPDGGLAGSGVIVVNPPWTLTDALDRLLKPLADRLRQSNECEGGWRWLVPERAGVSG